MYCTYYVFVRTYEGYVLCVKSWNMPLIKCSNLTSQNWIILRWCLLLYWHVDSCNNYQLGTNVSTTAQLVSSHLLAKASLGRVWSTRVRWQPLTVPMPLLWKTGVLIRLLRCHCMQSPINLHTLATELCWQVKKRKHRLSFQWEFVVYWATIHCNCKSLSPLVLAVINCQVLFVQVLNANRITFAQVHVFNAVTSPLLLSRVSYARLCV